MNDWVILSAGRWQLRRAIAIINRVITRLTLEKHPDKTMIGRVRRGFEFLGYWLSPRSIEMAKQTLQRCLDKSTRLYEQEANPLRLGAYLPRWKQCDDGR